MIRLYVQLVIVIATFYSNNSFGQVASKRIDTTYQQLTWIQRSVFAADSTNPAGTAAGGLKKSVTNPTLATFSINITANSGSSSASQLSQLQAWTPFTWGTVGILIPQVEFDMYTIMDASASLSDPYAKASSDLTFGHDSNPCRAYGKFEMTGPANQTALFVGNMDIIVSNLLSGDAGLNLGYWEVECGPNEITALSYGANWDVQGGYYSGGSYHDLSGFWPLDLNEHIVTDHVATVGNVFELRTDASDFEFVTRAGAGYGADAYSSMISSVTLGSSYWLE